MIQLKDIHFQYPQSDFNLNIENLSFADGSKTAVIGPSGFGKTTMLNLIAGILLPENGEVNIEDTLVNKLADKQRRNFRIQNIGFVFQAYNLIPVLTALENVKFVLELQGVDGGRHERAIADEPTGNLDPVNKNHIKNILFDAVEKHGATLITVTHDHEMLDGFDNVIDFKNFKSGTES